jgi:NADH:ubiquinone oxidoreductase subunit H
MVIRIVFNLMQILVVMGLSPLAIGVLNRLKEIIQSKRGPSILQPYRDVWKLFGKDEVVSEESSWIFRVTPYIVFVTPMFVALLIPVLTSYPLFWAFMADMVGAGSNNETRGNRNVSIGHLPQVRPLATNRSDVPFTHFSEPNDVLIPLFHH